MIDDVFVTFEGDHVLVRSIGKKNYETVETIWSKVSRLCATHNCFNVLGIGDTTEPMEAVEGYEHPAVFRKYGIDHRYRIAWVERNPDAVDVVELTINILANRDLPGRIFPTVDAAREWLLGGDDGEQLDPALSESRQSHWQRVHRDKEPADCSWYQPVPEESLQLITATGIAKTDPILDAGGGASTLVDNLLAAGYTDVSVLDISGAALERSRARLDSAADTVHWIEGDVTTFSPSRPYSLWHDRAVFHFLTDPKEREKYIAVVRKALWGRGHMILATFGPEGPLRCSGLEIERYDIDRQQRLFGAYFELRAHELDVHETPSGSSQQFLYSWWQLRD